MRKVVQDACQFKLRRTRGR